jgi:hypothetical protein
VAVAATVVLIGLGACDAGPSSPAVPRLSGGTGASRAAGGDGSAARRDRLHAAAECIRAHGAPHYQDPVLTAGGAVYTDAVSLRDLGETVLTAIDTACDALIHAADFSMSDQGPPPPRLIQAGVRSARCLRANGMPDVKDPTADSPFTPGKGFGLQPGELPAGGKRNPAFARAVGACRAILDDEARLSSLGSLGDA